MKKCLLILLAFTFLCNTYSKEISAEEPKIVCTYVENEDGELVEVCTETPTPYIFCTPECWDV